MTKKNQILVEKVKALYQAIQEKRESINAATNPCWETSLSIAFGVDGSTNVHDHVNILTIYDPKRLVAIFGKLVGKRAEYDGGVVHLEWDSAPDFEYMGYTFDQWKHDFQLRLNSLRMEDERKELEAREQKLDSILSKLPESVKKAIELDGALDDLSELEDLLT